MDPKRNASRIVKLDITNFKRIKSVKIEAQEINVIGGRNAQGKSSLLDAIATALGGGRVAPPEPVRAGQKRCDIVLELNGLTVERHQTQKATRLVVKDKEGNAISSPQQLLDRLWNTKTVDPAAFMRLSAQGQLERVRDVVGLDFADLDLERERLYDQRRQLNRTIKEVSAAVANMPAYPDAPAEVVSINDLVTELETARETNRLRAQATEAVVSTQHQIADVDADISEVKAEIRRLEGTLTELGKRRGVAAGKLLQQETAAAEMAEVDSAPIQARLESAEEVNEQVRANAARSGKCTELAKFTQSVEKMNGRMEAIDDQKRQAITQAAFPVEGLSFDHTGLRYNDKPFEQASSAEKWRVSVAMGLALNPELKVLLIREGEKLDDDSRKLMADMAKEAGAQLWIEDCRAGDDEATVVIEDGSIKSEIKEG